MKLGKWTMAGVLLLLLSSLALSEGKPATTPLITLTPENALAFRGEVTDASISDAERDLLGLITKRGDGAYPIYLVLDSPGGDVDSGLDFIRWAKQYPNIHTVTIFAASMAAAIVEGLPGQRYMDERGVIMFHRAKGGFQGQFEDGEVESRLGWAKDIIRSMEQANADRMQLSLADYKRQIKDELWLFGDKSVKQHATDMIVQLKCSPELIAQKNKVSVQMMFLTMDFEFSKCPLLRSGTPSTAAAGRFYQKNKQVIDTKFTKPMLLK